MFLLIVFCDTLPPLANSDHLGLSFAVAIAKPRLTPTSCGIMRRVWRYAFADFDLANDMLLPLIGVLYCHQGM